MEQDSTRAALDQWWDWLDALRVKLGTRDKPASYAAIAMRTGLHHNSVLNWLKASVPSVDQEAKLAELSGDPLEHLRAMLDAARHALLVQKLASERARLERQSRMKRRPMLGMAGPPVVPVPPRDPRSRRPRGKGRIVGGLLLMLTTGGGWGLGQPLPGATPRLITDAKRDSVAFRARRPRAA